MRQRNIKGYRFASKQKFLDSLAAVGENASDEAVLAEYDKRAGLLFKEVKGQAERLETGAFWDFAKGEAKKVKKVAKKTVKKTVKKATKSKKSKKK